MKIIGMLDSPYVRRVVISAKLMGLVYEHQSLSVFRNFDEFSKINPLVKAPTLVCEDGGILMDSILILDYLEELAHAQKRLTPASGADRRLVLHLVGIGLVACEKSVQAYYELTLRPEDKRHEPWLDRVTGQMIAAYNLLEREVTEVNGWFLGKQISQADITIAVAWRFTEYVLPGLLDKDRYPALAAFSKRAEALPEFITTPLD